MKDFKENLKKRLVLASIVFFGLLVIFFIQIHQQNFGVNHDNEFVVGYQVGGILGLAVLALYNIVRYSYAIRSEAFLKKLHIAETDERNRFIFEKSGSLGMNIVMFSLVGVGIIAGYYSELVSLTLIGATIGVGLIRLTLKVYYKGKY